MNENKKKMGKEWKMRDGGEMAGERKGREVKGI